MIELHKCDVVFDEDEHHYSLYSKPLSGITSLIHKLLDLGNYPDASEYVKNVLVPRAGERGKTVHKAIEFYDSTGLRSTTFAGDYGSYNVSDELDGYIRLRQGFLPVANEYTVSDLDKWASQIDNVWLKKGTDEIWLADTKTNNTKLYPGGVNALKEYLSWQLSIYAYLFEMQNPGLRVSGLVCNWLRKDEAEQWVIERKTSEQVKWILSSTYMVDDDGHIGDYANDVPPPFTTTDEIAPTNALPEFANSAIMMITQVMREQDEMKRIADEMKDKLREAMEHNGIKSWDCGAFKATIAKDSTTKTFDTSRLKTERPEIYNEYITEKPKKGGFSIKLRDNERE